MRAREICLLLLMHLAVFARSFALASAGNSIAARIAMMAMTTSNSINVNARRSFVLCVFILLSRPPRPAAARQSIVAFHQAAMQLSRDSGAGATWNDDFHT